MSPISSYKPEKKFFKDERCHIVEIHNRNDDDVCSIAMARLEPGVTTQLHALRGTSERYVIVDGEGQVEVDGFTPVVVQPFDIVSIPAEASQRIANTSKRDLKFLCICTPRFRPEIYINKEI